MKPDKHLELSRLVTLALHRQLDEEGLVRLETRLRHDPEARRVYLELMMIQVGLSDACASQVGLCPPSNRALFRQVVERDILSQEIRRPAPGPVEETNPMPHRYNVPRRRFTRRDWFKAIFTTAALIGFTAGAIWLDQYCWQQTSRPGAVTRPLARVADGLQARWSGPAFSAGLDIYRGTLTLEEGLARLVFVNGVVTILQAPVTLELISPDDIVLIGGSLTCSVPPAASGFRVRTRACDVIDYGTEFGVSVGLDGMTEAHVFKGEVGVRDWQRPPGGLAPMRLIAGQAVQAGGGGPARRVVASAAGFVLGAEFEAIKLADKGSSYHRWLAYSYRMRRDPALVAYYPFIRSPGQDGALVNLAAATDGLLTGSLGSSAQPGGQPRWTVGRWPDKEALEFEAASHQMVVLPPDPALRLTGDMTAMWWMKRHAGATGAVEVVVSYGGRGLESNFYYSHGFENGQLRAFHEYGVDEDARVLVANPGANDRWTHVAVVRQAQTRSYTVYLDGQPAGSGVYPRNYDGEPRSDMVPAIGGASGFDQEYFNGVLDELALYRRALTGQEILEHCTAGRP